MKLSLTLFCTMLIGTQAAFAPLPDGYGGLTATGNAGTLRRAVSDWSAGGTSKNTVVAKYGPIEEWDVSEVTNMKDLLYDPGYSTFQTFNADLSNWNTGAVTTMQGSKCTLAPSLWPRLPCLCILNIRQLEVRRVTSLTRIVVVFCGFEIGTFFVACVGLSLLSCSVCSRRCVQFRRVQLEYKCSDKYAME